MAFFDYLLLIFGVIVPTLFVYLTWNFDYWKKRNVFSPKAWPWFGNYPKSAVLLTNPMYEMRRLYRSYKKSHRFIGVYDRRTPKLLILDHKLVNDIYVKHFRHFPYNDSSNYFNPKLDPIFCQNIFATRGDEWKEVRRKLSPALTASKLKAIYSIIQGASEMMVEFISVKIDKTGNCFATLDAKELANRYTADAVINCIYGLNCNAFAENSEVHSMLVRNFSPSLKRNAINVVLNTFPFIEKIYQQPFFPPELTEWLYGIMAHALELRSIGSSVQRQDLLNFLVELKESNNYSDDKIAAFASIFFFNGYETTSTVLVQVLYQLAKNQQCQDKLREEIMNVNGMTWAVVNDLKYLENVVNETLRIAPSPFLMAKTCAEPIDVQDYDGKVVRIEKGTCIQLPLYAIHHDDDYYREPDTFQPERFDSKSLKELRDHGLFLPFGNGPRICLGQRLAILQIKLAVIHTIQRYAISVNANANAPHALSLDALLTPISDVYLEYRRINSCK